MLYWLRDYIVAFSRFIITRCVFFIILIKSLTPDPNFFKKTITPVRIFSCLKILSIYFVVTSIYPFCYASILCTYLFSCSTLCVFSYHPTTAPTCSQYIYNPQPRPCYFKIPLSYFIFSRILCSTFAQSTLYISFLLCIDPILFSSLC